MSVTDVGFELKDILIMKGQAAVLVMTRKIGDTYATAAIFMDTGRKRDLPLNQPVRVDLTSVSPGTLHSSCAMNVEKGTVTIEGS